MTLLRVLAAGQNAVRFDFGNFKLGEISGTAFEDLDSDGVRDAGEQGLAGWVAEMSQRPSTWTWAPMTTLPNHLSPPNFWRG